MRFVYKVCVSVSIRCHCIVNLIVTLLFVAADNSVMSTSDINNIKPIKQAESLYYNYFWGRKINLSGKAQPIRTRSDQIRYTLTCHGVTTFREFWAQSARFGQNGSWYESCGARFFCGNPDDLSATSQRRFSPNLVTKRSSVSRRGIRKDIFKTHYFRGHLPPKSEIENRSNRHLTQSRLQVMGCPAEKYCVLHIVVLRPGSFQDLSTFLYDVPFRNYGASKLANFRILPYFPYTKPLKRTFR